MWAPYLRVYGPAAHGVVPPAGAITRLGIDALTRNGLYPAVWRSLRKAANPFVFAAITAAAIAAHFGARPHKTRLVQYSSMKPMCNSPARNAPLSVTRA